MVTYFSILFGLAFITIGMYAVITTVKDIASNGMWSLDINILAVIAGVFGILVGIGLLLFSGASGK